MRLLDKPSDFSKYKTMHGLRQDTEPGAASAYILERTLIRILNREAKEKGVEVLADEAYNTGSIKDKVDRLERMIDVKIYTLRKIDLKAIVKAYYKNGIASCLRKMIKA